MSCGDDAGSSEATRSGVRAKLIAIGGVWFLGHTLLPLVSEALRKPWTSRAAISSVEPLIGGALFDALLAFTLVRGENAARWFMLVYGAFAFSRVPSSAASGALASDLTRVAIASALLPLALYPAIRNHFIAHRRAREPLAVAMPLAFGLAFLGSLACLVHSARVVHSARAMPGDGIPTLSALLVFITLLGLSRLPRAPMWLGIGSTALVALSWGAWGLVQLGKGFVGGAH